MTFFVFNENGRGNKVAIMYIFEFLSFSTSIQNPEYLSDALLALFKL